jgi:hypothetical protein
VLAKTVRHFLPSLGEELSRLPDRRDPDCVVYPKANLVWSAIWMLLLGLGSRRQFRFESATPAFVANLNAQAGSDVDTAPHDDTVVYYLEPLRAEAFEKLPVHVVTRLIRMKALDRWRVHERFLVAIDGTGQLFFHERHCEHCLTRKAAHGQTLYFHPVLEAKLVTAGGLVFSMATEFIENQDPKATAQDCELKAFYRLADKLRAHFPQLPIILLGDSLYACKPVFDLCQKNHWGFIFTFKRGSMPALFAEFETLRDLAVRNRVEHRSGDIVQQFAWVNDLDYQGHRLSALQCIESRPEDRGYFAWITNLPVGPASVVILSNQGGRLRWKIENEGFNTQKNGGYELEHAYSTHEQAAKIFYLLLQVAHALNQLMIHGSLLADFAKTFGSVRNYLRRLAEALRQTIIDPAAWDPHAARAMQIRFDSS